MGPEGEAGSVRIIVASMVDKEGKPRKTVLRRRKYIQETVSSQNPTVSASGPHSEVNPSFLHAPISNKEPQVSAGENRPTLLLRRPG